MERIDFFPYNWNIVVDDDEEQDFTLIRAYGLDIENKLIVIVIRDFTPFVYLELPEKYNWNTTNLKNLKNLIIEKLGPKKPVQIKMMWKKRLYGAEFNKENNMLDLNDRKLFPYLFLAFNSPTHIYALKRIIRYETPVPGIGKIKLKIHEDNANAVLQLICLRNIPICGWINFIGKKIEKNKSSYSDYEYEVLWKNLTLNDTITKIPQPLILSYDLEVYSSVKGSMPKSHRPDDEIFQISCILGRQGEESYKEYILTLFDPDPKITGENVIIRKFKTEAALISGFTEFIHEFQPNIITGYNIFEFDIDYMIKRSKYRSCFYEFAKQGLNREGLDKEKIIEWSSSAFKNQKFLYLQAEGRLYIDLLPVVKRDYKFRAYNLKTVSTHFLGETKDPLTPEGIFNCYLLGKKGEESDNVEIKNKGRRAMGQVSKYCVQDSVLVFKIFEKIQTWIGLTEMSKVCNTPIFDLFTKGQQNKVFSQVYKKCMDENFVVEKDGFQAGENESYTGAHVFEPISGVHDWVIPVDFSSLYPSVIIAYNICWTTWVKNDSEIPNSVCHIFDWYDHFGCEHDTIKRTGKKVICEKRYYRFLKSPKGILPEILENLLEARNRVKTQIKMIKKDSLEKESLLNVLDKRQLAYKISCNSMYGILGVRKGYLPFMPGAMCVTAKGRESIKKVSKIATEELGLIRIYGDTDSCYLKFPGLNDPTEIWDKSIQTAKEISKHFPPPMELLFEMTIYKRFMILTKKRYMSIECDRDGKEKKEISKKGVLLARRDNSQAVRDIYSSVVMDIFNLVPEDVVLDNLLQKIMSVCRGELSYKQFIVTKRVGEISDYKIRELPKDEKKKLKRLEELECDEEEYKFRCLPAQAQLLLKMQKRGENVGAGTRLEYVITTLGGYKAKQWKKIEDSKYFIKNSSILKLDYLYYIKNLSTQMDQVLNVVYKKDKYVLNLYRQLLKTFIQREKVIENFEQCISPIFVENFEQCIIPESSSILIEPVKKRKIISPKKDTKIIFVEEI